MNYIQKPKIITDLVTEALHKSLRLQWKRSDGSTETGILVNIPVLKMGHSFHLVPSEMGKYFVFKNDCLSLLKVSRSRFLKLKLWLKVGDYRNNQIPNNVNFQKYFRKNNKEWGKKC